MLDAMAMTRVHLWNQEVIMDGEKKIAALGVSTALVLGLTPALALAAGGPGGQRPGPRAVQKARLRRRGAAEGLL